MGRVIVQKVGSCNAAELPENIGVSELDLLVLEDKSCDSLQEAIALVDALEDAPRFVAVKTLVPIISAKAKAAIKKIQSDLPELREQYIALAQVDPATGEETWKTKWEEAIIERVRNLKSGTKSCKGCGTKCIPVAHIRTYLCPVCLTHPFLETDTDAGKIKERAEKIRSMREAVENPGKRIAEIEAEAMKNSDEFKRMWVVFEAQTPGATQGEDSDAEEFVGSTEIPVEAPAEVAGDALEPVEGTRPMDQPEAGEQDGALEGDVQAQSGDLVGVADSPEAQ
jgi:hypothetical protein